MLPRDRAQLSEIDGLIKRPLEIRCSSRMLQGYSVKFSLSSEVRFANFQSASPLQRLQL